MPPFKQEQKLLSLKSDYSIKCKCGCSTVIYHFENRTKKVCKWCGNYVYINKQEEFKDRMKQLIENK